MIKRKGGNEIFLANSTLTWLDLMNILPSDKLIH